MTNPDLDGYPILRLDQLSLIDIPTLEKSIPDARALLESLREECSQGAGKSQKSMIKYLQKQLDQTAKEVATRSAEDRVNAMLRGTKELMVRTIPVDIPTPSTEKIQPTPPPPAVDTSLPHSSASSLSSTSVPKPASSSVSSSNMSSSNMPSSNMPSSNMSSSNMSSSNMSSSDVSSKTSTSNALSNPSQAMQSTNTLPPNHPKQYDPPPVAFYKPIPLPSQLAAAAAAANDNKPKLSRALAKEREQGEDRSGGGDGSVHMSRSAGSQREKISEGGGELLTSRSSGGSSGGLQRNRGTVSSVSVGNSGGDDDSNDSNNNSNSKPRRRPRSGSAVSSAEQSKPKSIYSQANLSGPSEKQNQLALQQNFGNAFMVRATEKKKRFFPKKVVQETDAERREKLREKGRNQAMMRLLDRKNKQIERNEEMKLRRLEEKNIAAKKKKEAIEKRHKRMEQQRIYQREKQAAQKKEEERNALKKSTPSSSKEHLNGASSQAKPTAVVMNAEMEVEAKVLAEVDATGCVSSDEDDQSLSGGDDDPTQSVIIPQTEVDEVVQESAAVFDSYRLRNMAMKISSDSDSDGDIPEGTSVRDQSNAGEVVVDDVTEVKEDHDYSSPGRVDHEKNRAALHTLRKLKQKKKTSSETEATPTVKDEEGDEDVPDGMLSFDNFQCADGVKDIMFVDENHQLTEGVFDDQDAKKAKKRGKKSRGAQEGELSGVEEDGTETKKKRKKKKKKRKVIVINADGEEVEVTEGEDEGGDTEKEKKRKKRKKKVKRIIVNDNGEEVEVIEEIEVSEKKKKTKTVTRLVVNEAGEEVEVVEEVEVPRKKKKKKRDMIQEEGDTEANPEEKEEKKDEDDKEQRDREETASDSAVTESNGNLSSQQAIDSNKKTTYDSSYAKLNYLFCSFFAPDSIFSTLVEKTPEETSGSNEGERTVHTTSVGPDSLPGLSAWVLASINAEGQPEWTVDPQHLLQDAPPQSPRHSSLQQQRSTSRQEVSYGIVLLARVCETLLTGKDFKHAQQKEIETRFRSDWQNRVAQFDSIVAELSSLQQDTLFKRIFVCGNTAAVVSKLEHLVTTAFRHPSGSGYAEAEKNHEEKMKNQDVEKVGQNITDTDRVESEKEDEEEDRESGGVVYPSGSDTDSLDPSEYDDDSSDDDYMDHFHGAIDMLKAEGAGQKDMLSGDETALTEEEMMKTLLGQDRDEESEECGDKQKKKKDSRRKDVRESDRDSNNSDETNSESDSDRDRDLEAEESMVLPDSSIVFADDAHLTTIPLIDAKPTGLPPKIPLSDNKIPTFSERKPSNPPNKKKETGNNETAGKNSAKADSSRSNRKGMSRDRSSSSVPTTKPANEVSNAADTDTPPVKITDVYNSIAEIFPAVRAKMDSMQAACRPGDHAILAKILLESMHIQLKVYEDWLEVMDDYATVFCADKEKGVQMLIEDGGDKNAAVYSGGSAALHFRVKSSRPEVNNIIKDVFGNVLKGWEELPTGLGLGVSWNILWSWTKPKINMTQLLIWQRVNHFQNSKELTRKDTLKKNLQKYTSAIGNKASGHFEIMPQTFLLPAEYTLFVKEYSAQDQAKAAYLASDGKLPPVRNMWIVKPVGLSRGRGISMLEDLSTLTYSQSTVLQKYIDNPLCLDGYKFDLRIYVLVTSFQPLEAFIYKDGFARISTVKYSTDEKSLSNLYIHLTNSSIQKHSENGPTKDNPLHISQGNNDESNGSKIGLLGKTGLWKRLEKYDIDCDQMWEAMCLLIVKSLVVVDDKIPNQPCNFELFGYDVLFDQNLRPWLIEVNSGPSLARENQLDIRVKNALINDIIKLVDPPPFDRAALTKVLRQRINDLQQKKFSMTSGDPDLEKDLKAILGSTIPRRYGELPKECGNFERLCPGTKNFSNAMKLKSKLVKTPSATTNTMKKNKK